MQQQILGLVNPAIAALFAGLFVYLWLRDRGAVHIAGFATCYTLLAVGFLIFHYAPDPDGMGVVLLMHVVYSGGVTALCWALCHRVGVRLRLKAALAICALSAGMVALTAFTPNHLPRIFAVSTCYGLMFALTAQILSRSAMREPVDRIVLAMIILTATQFFLRPYITFVLEDGLTISAYRDSAFYSVTVVVIGVISLMLAMALVAMCVIDQFDAIRAEIEEDPLSGLLTRRAFEQASGEFLDKAYAKKQPVSVIVADIDHFKRVNDIWGHQAGDNAIAAFGALLKEKVRLGDKVGRIGGEEFCVLVRDCELRAAHGLAERIRQSFTALRIEGLPADLHLTASFGVAEWRYGEGYATLFGRADAALYAAKDSGRNRVKVEGGERDPAEEPPAMPLAGRSAA